MGNTEMSNRFTVKFSGRKDKYDKGKYFIYDNEVHTVMSRNLDYEDAMDFAVTLNKVDEFGSLEEKIGYQMEDGLF